ncbi:SMP-30/gluconolactonase/LRE family protein [Novosphingobium sp. PS1R-30]|uniref:SMP-30/gluconolactonase/LRE family protein n=1 Tax=Novosphingobium anseongense TaxID=3133436 RepID=A0ABU8S2S4_9SPHN
MDIQPRLAWPLRAELAEGPVWCPEESAFRFVDIKRGTLHRFEPATGSRETIEIGGAPSFILPARDGQFVVGTGHAIRSFDGHRLGEPLAVIEMPAHNRTNDATVDAAGRLWFGTMDDDERTCTGGLHSFANDQMENHGWRATVTNGPAFNRAGDALYHVDSGRRIVWRIEVRDGRPAPTGEIFLRLDESEGYPDGVTVDSEDCLWVALWDGWGLRRYAPDGSLMMEVGFPCARVTKVAFGGPELTTAFVTTARVGLGPQALEDQPEAGGLFIFEAPAPGRLMPAVHA